MGTISKTEFDALEGNIKETFDGYFEKTDVYINDFYNVITDVQAQMTFTTDGAMSQMEDWNGSVAYDSFNFGYSKQFRYDKKSKGIKIPRDMWEEKEYRRIKNVVTKVRHSVLKTLRFGSALIFNSAFGTTITGPDGLGLCSASHRITPSDETGVQSNTGTLELNYDNLETTQLAMQDFKDDRDDKMLIEGNHIICGPQLRKTCAQLFGTDKEAYVSDNQPNFYKNFSYSIHPLITGKKWFLVCKELMEQGDGLTWWMRRDPRTIERDGDLAKGDFDTEEFSWKSVGSWKAFWVNWWFIYGQNPA